MASGADTANEQEGTFVMVKGGEPLPLVDALDAPSRHSPTPVRVALVNMPFALEYMPSVQCGLLKAELARAGHTVDVHYFNLEAAAALGPDRCRQLLSLGIEEGQTGEWLFSVAAFGYRPDEAAYRAACPGVDDVCEQLGLSFAELSRLRNETVPALVEAWATAIDWSVYTAVGFSSTFQQQVASLALARRIKERYPQVSIIFGGTNVDGEMGPEYVRAIPWIDYTVVGEGDEVLPALVARLAQRLSGAGLPGVVARRDGAVVDAGPAPAVRHLDALPDPDYDDFFVALRRLGSERALGTASPFLPVESSRGCWWGEKHHCTFCGFFGSTLAYRSKSPERVLAELQRLADRYHVLDFNTTDAIFDMRYIDGLCRPLSEERRDYRLFYEVKANLTRGQLKAMGSAGFSMIQPGIESLSTHVLDLMRKGTTMLLNIRLLKWARYYGLKVGWNLLMGFPGETRADYALQERLIPLLWHLPPPHGVGRVRLDRFSPYFDDSSFPVQNVEPFPAYRFLYPIEGIDLHKIAYFFRCDMGDTVPVSERKPLVEVALDWQERWERSPQPSLVYHRGPNWLQILDCRDPAKPRTLALQGEEAEAYECCSETDHTAARVAEHLRSSCGIEADVAETQATLRRMCELEVMIEEDGHFLSLALPANRNW
jgi:ribosomal peptide maturation radical SAM protein 1